MKHVNTGDCPLCNEKLKDAHPRLRAFWKPFQAEHKDAHISWTFRGEADQNDAVRRGTSSLKWPLSKHNKRPSLALDAFRLLPTGADWGHKWYNEVFGPAVEAFGLKWGGRFKRPDRPHCELLGDGE
jgi:hypothetical protein